MYVRLGDVSRGGVSRDVTNGKLKREILGEDRARRTCTLVVLKDIWSGCDHAASSPPCVLGSDACVAPPRSPRSRFQCSPWTTCHRHMTPPCTQESLKPVAPKISPRKTTSAESGLTSTDWLALNAPRKGERTMDTVDGETQVRRRTARSAHSTLADINLTSKRPNTTVIGEKNFDWKMTKGQPKLGPTSVLHEKTKRTLASYYRKDLIHPTALKGRLSRALLRPGSIASPLSHRSGVSLSMS